MIKKIIAGVALLATTVAAAQENNASPYSYYGLGDVKFKGTVENRSMGGLSILPDSIHINLQNPASHSYLGLTTFTIGAGNSATRFKSTAGKDDANRTTLDYLAVGLPMKKLGMVFGLMPYTSVGYKIQNTTTDDDGLTRNRQFNGKGGLNRVFLGAGYQITPKFSLGADFQYNFGNIETKSIIGMPLHGVQYSTREINASRYNGVSFNIGAIYNTKINNKLSWITSVTYSPETQLKSTTERTIATIEYSSIGNEIPVDVIDVNTSDDNVKMPSKISFGTGFGEKMKWFAGAEYTFQESNEFGNRFDNLTATGFETAHKMTLGGYYIPNYRAYGNYFNRVTYRAGLKYEKTGLVINNQSIDDYSLSLGMGLPLGNYIGGSNINIGAEFGRRGTTKSNLIQENYVNIFVSLSLNDRWFVKRKYD